MTAKFFCINTVFVFIFIASAQAQGNSLKDFSALDPDYSEEVETMEWKGMNLSALRNVNVRIHRDMLRRYKKASGIMVSEGSRHTFVYCTIDDVNTRIDYTKKGAWLHTYRYLPEPKLPQALVNRVLKTHPCSTIVNAVQITTMNEKVLLVNLENGARRQIILLKEDDLYGF